MLGFIKKLIGAGASTDFKQLVTHGAVIVDVRTPTEFRGGHIKGAVNIPLDQLRTRLGDLKKKQQPVITCCRSGARSGVAKGILKAAGLECYNGGPWNLLERKLH